MNSLQLKKLTGNGYTILPNRIIDAVLKTASKHTADALALVLYLVRHIPGQHGTLILSGDYSQTNICNDLGWGITNRARLKRALADLAQTGAIFTELQSNNTVLVHIKAELDLTPQSATTNTLKTPCKESFKEPPERKQIHCPPPSKISFKAPLKIPKEIKEIKKSENNKNHHHMLSTSSASTLPDMTQKNDDVDKLLRLYRSTFKHAISPGAALAFAQTYWQNDRPLHLVEQGFCELASHPILKARTTSPNAVWELAFMRKEASRHDCNIRQIIDSLRYHSSSDDDCYHCINRLISSQHLDHDLFHEYYGSAIQQVFQHRQRDREVRRQCNIALDENNNTMPAFDKVKLEEVSRSEETLPTTTTDTTEEESMPPITAAPFHVVSDNLNDHTMTCAETQLLPVHANQIDVACSKPEHGIKFKKNDIAQSSNNSRFCGTKARTKEELILLIQQFVSNNVICRQELDRLETLLNIAKLSTVDFKTLEKLVQQHLTIIPVEAA